MAQFSGLARKKDLTQKAILEEGEESEDLFEDSDDPDKPYDNNLMDGGISTAEKSPISEPHTPIWRIVRGILG